MKLGKSNLNNIVFVDENSHGTTSRLCELLLRLLCGKSRQQALRQNNTRPNQLGERGSRRDCSNASSPGTIQQIAPYQKLYTIIRQ